jgi:transketolase
MALAARWHGQNFNRPDHAIFDYRVFAVCGDGDMMEGVTSEAASFAGHQMLGNLCWIYDSNRITIEGHTDIAFSDDVAGRFLAYGWNVERVGDVNDTERLAQAIEKFKTGADVPTLVIVNSHIGFGAPHKQDTSAAHGEPHGEEEVRLAKRSYGWPEDAHTNDQHEFSLGRLRRAAAHGTIDYLDAASGRRLPDFLHRAGINGAELSNRPSEQSISNMCARARLLGGNSWRAAAA